MDTLEHLSEHVGETSVCAHTVGQKTVPMFGYFANIEVEKIKKIR